ncbi:hypothetical protein ZWY2020_037616 [Hordeum vulgare]|nr:hypothetical protein ZWY2020_037616 [Hordeum vulgare]
MDNQICDSQQPVLRYKVTPRYCEPRDLGPRPVFFACATRCATTSSSARRGCHTDAVGAGTGVCPIITPDAGSGAGNRCLVTSPDAAAVANSPDQSSSSGLPSRPNRKRPASAELSTDELDVLESVGDCTLSWTCWSPSASAAVSIIESRQVS